MRDGSLREKGVDSDLFFPSVRFIHAKGLPMHRALFVFVVALGLIAASMFEDRRAIIREWVKIGTKI